MNAAQQKKFDSLYRQHLSALRRQGKADSTIDVYARAPCRVTAYWNKCPRERLINASRELRYQAFILCAYGMGLRLSEVLSLQVRDIDSARMQLHIRQSNKDRFVILPALRRRNYLPFASTSSVITNWSPTTAPTSPSATRTAQSPHSARRGSAVATAPARPPQGLSARS